MTIQQCIYVRKIAEVGSFNEAAKQLFIAQSSLSTSIKALEQELGIKLFERSKNGVFLTDDGTEFIRYAGHIAEYNDFVAERYNSEKKCNRLYVVTQHYDFIADIFGKMLKETEADSYKFSLIETKTNDVIKRVESSRADIGIIAIKDSDDTVMRRYLDQKGLSFTPFLTASPHVFLRKGHPLLKYEKLSYDILSDYPYVSYEQGSRNTSFFTEEIMDELNVKKHIEISDRATLMNVLLLTDCYTIGTGIMPSELNNGSIESVELESDAFYTIGYIVRAENKLSDSVNEFIQFLESSAENISSR